MSCIRLTLCVLSLTALLGCEKVIDVDLNSAEPKVVIVADLNTSGRVQQVQVSRTVNFNDQRPFEPVSDAQVAMVCYEHQQYYTFTYQDSGVYVLQGAEPFLEGEYLLSVKIGEDSYGALSRLEPFVEVDSIGLVREAIFGDDYYFVNLKFQDPAGEDNYYKYQASVNGEPFRFVSVQSDKYNDGKLVTHQIGAPDREDLFVGDQLIVRRSVIPKDVYDYWSTYQMTSPVSAAPSNPISNFNRGALGYFSISHQRDYTVTITPGIEVEKEDLE